MVIILSKNQEEVDQIRDILTEENYDCDVLQTIKDLDSELDQGAASAAFIDIDSVPIDNRLIRKLTLKHPSVYFFCMSRDKFHPELKDAICYHIYACLNKPLDPDELVYWLRCISSNENESRPTPNSNGSAIRDKAT